jgi:ribosome-associated protein
MTGRDDGSLRVTRSLAIPLDEIEVRVSTSGGPGGQHANRSHTRVDVSFDVAAAAALGPRQRARLLERLGPVVRAGAADTRSQARNRELALDRLRGRLAAALAVEPPRRPTRPTASARAERVEDKRRRGERKAQRRRPPVED